MGYFVSVFTLVFQSLILVFVLSAQGIKNYSSAAHRPICEYNGTEIEQQVRRLGVLLKLCSVGSNKNRYCELARDCDILF
jgi:hypothetical protein